MFKKEWRTEKQKHYDIKKRPTTKYPISGKEYLIYDNVNLSVFTTNICNASCKFCVAQLRYLNDKKEYDKPCINCDQDYYDRLDYVLSQIIKVNPSVSITGGEPTLDAKLPTILKILNKYNVRKRTITSNGSGLLKLDSLGEKTILQHLIDYKLEHLNISRVHFDEKTNQDVMRFRENYISNEDIKKIVEICSSNNIRVRMSCLLNTDGINDFEGVKQYIEWCKSIGVNNVVFRQPMKYDEENAVKTEITEYCSSKSVDLMPIYEQMEQDEEFKFVNQVLGYYYYVEVYNYKGVDVVCETADLKQIAKEKSKYDEKIIYEMILHPNGNLCGSWNEYEDIMI